MSSTSTPITNINEIDASQCEGATFSNISMKNSVTVNIDSMVSAMSSSETKQDMEKAMQAQAKSTAEAGLGWSDSEANAVIRSVTDLSTAINETVSTMSDASIYQRNGIKCGKNQIFSNLDFENTTDLVIKQITQSESVTQAEQKLKEQLEALGVSKAKGLDPTAMFALGMVAIVLVTAFMLFGGVGFVAKTVTSSAFWMLACGVLSGFLTYALTSTWLGTWPSKPLIRAPAADATPEQIAAHKAANDEIIAKNKLIRKITGATLPIAVVATALFGWMTIKTQK